jgi:hypothetical protein
LGKPGWLGGLLSVRRGAPSRSGSNLSTETGLVSTEQPAERREVESNDVGTALDSTIASLQGGVERLGIEAALPIIGDWEERLAASGSPDLAPVAENLTALRTQLSSGSPDQVATGEIIVELSEQVQRLANEDIQIEVADKLSQLSVLLSNEGDSLSGRA